jgi:hypothetical protein
MTDVAPASPYVFTVAGARVILPLGRYRENDTVAIRLCALTGEPIATVTLFNQAAKPDYVRRMLVEYIVYVKDVGECTGMYDELIASGIVQCINNYPYARLNPDLVPFVPEMRKHGNDNNWTTAPTAGRPAGRDAVTPDNHRTTTARR